MKKRIMWVGFAITAIALIVFSVISAEIYYDNDVAYSHRYLRAYMAAFDDTRTEEQLDAGIREGAFRRIGRGAWSRS